MTPAVLEDPPTVKVTKTGDDTHYIWPDALPGRLVRAACGRLIDRKKHSNFPTCFECRLAVDEFNNLKVE